LSRDILSKAAPPANFRLNYGPERYQFGDLYLPDGPAPHPVVIGIHGGFWRAAYTLDYYGHLCEALAGAGVAAWNIEYRRIGNRGGGWPGTFLDVARAADYLREIAATYELDLSRIVTLGHSAGGHLAFWLGARPKISPGDPLFSASPLALKALVSLAGVVDLRRAYELRLGGGVTKELLGGSPSEVPQRYHSGSAFELLPLGVPQVLIHGMDDLNVPYEIATRYHAHARSRGDPVSLVSLPGAGHFECVDPRTREWTAVQTAVARAISSP
jgi:acetyl esterase/lipase